MKTKDRIRVTGYTIDGPHSRDLDDAIHIREVPGGFVLEVHVADVSSGVEMNSDLDRAARETGYTRYHARGNDPMLPRHLSEGSLSLFQGKERNTVTVSIPISSTLETGEAEIFLSTLTSSAKLTYELVDNTITTDTPHPHKAELVLLRKISEALLNKRRAEGAFAIYDIFSGWMTTEEGLLTKIIPDRCHFANIIIQECMILANIAVAEYLAKRDIQALFRNHTAKAIAPDREALLMDYANSLSNSANFPIATLQSRLALTLNRATLGPTIEGHYGLNLPSYIRFTSPIRRFDDLVNHRILLATLNELPPPYAPDELESLARHLTAIEHAIKDARAASFKEERKKQIGKAVERGSFVRMNGGDFHSIIKAVARSDGPTVEFAEEVARRLGIPGALLPRDVYYLLLETTQAVHPAWADIKMKTFRWLAVQPENAVSLLNQGVQEKHAVAPPHFKDSSTGPDHARQFSATAKITWDDTDFESAEQSAASKKEAQQLAALDLIRQITNANILEDEMPKRVAPKPQSAAAAPVQVASGNYVSALQERLTQMKEPLPDYTASSEGASHMPTFTCVCTIMLRSGAVVKGDGKGPNKQAAKQKAAEAAFEKLNK